MNKELDSLKDYLYPIEIKPLRYENQTLDKYVIITAKSENIKSDSVLPLINSDKVLLGTKQNNQSIITNEELLDNAIEVYEKLTHSIIDEVEPFIAKIDNSNNSFVGIITENRIDLADFAIEYFNKLSCEETGSDPKNILQKTDYRFSLIEDALWGYGVYDFLKMFTGKMKISVAFANSYLYDISPRIQLGIAVHQYEEGERISLLALSTNNHNETNLAKRYKYELSVFLKDCILRYLATIDLQYVKPIILDILEINQDKLMFDDISKEHYIEIQNEIDTFLSTYREPLTYMVFTDYLIHRNNIAFNNQHKWDEIMRYLDIDKAYRNSIYKFESILVNKIIRERYELNCLKNYNSLKLKLSKKP